MGCRQRLTEKGSTRQGRGVAVREPRANAAADLLSQGPAAAAAAGGGGASSVARPLLSSSSCVVVRRVSSVVCRRLSLSVVVGCVFFCLCCRPYTFPLALAADSWFEMAAVTAAATEGRQ